MIGPIQNLSSPPAADATVNKPAQNPKPPAPPAVPQDTVTISEGAKQAQLHSKTASVRRDVDHDGDSR
jgi:hypothetical protein